MVAISESKLSLAPVQSLHDNFQAYAVPVTLFSGTASMGGKPPECLEGVKPRTGTYFAACSQPSGAGKFGEGNNVPVQALSPLEERELCNGWKTRDQELLIISLGSSTSHLFAKSLGSGGY